jgi:hypothetical protein
MSWEMTSALSSVVATTILMITVPYASRQLREARLARTLPLLAEFQEKYNAPALRALRQRIFSGDVTGHVGLTEPDRADLDQIVEILEFIGFLVDKDLVDFDLVHSIFLSPDLVWSGLEPGVLEYRQKSPRYAYHFERLAMRYR